MELLLHYAWKHKIFPLKELRTTLGQTVEILDVGLHNTNAGPDFFNAKVKIDGTLWVGNIEIHSCSSEWYKHGHHKDEAYNSVILHIAETIDTPVTRSDGERIPQMQLSCPETLKAHYLELCHTDMYPPCYKIIPSLPSLLAHSWMSTLQSERLEQKTEQVMERLKHCNGNWEDAFFITLARNFGFSLNSEAFERWAHLIPLRAVDKHRDNLFQIEAIFFGQAGFLEEEICDEYYEKLQKEYLYLAHKFNLQRMDVSLWRFLRLRPGNFPSVRMAQLAWLYYQSQGLLSQLLEITSLEQAKAILSAGTSEYWETHYRFGEPSPKRRKTLSRSSIDLLLINTVCTFLFAYGRHKNDETLCQRAIRFLEVLKPENNHITRMWNDCGLKAESAADTQALIQLKKEYCDRKRCLYCRFGYEFLKRI